MTYLLRLVACLFLCVSLNSFGATIYGFNKNYDVDTNYQEIIAFDINNGQTSSVGQAPDFFIWGSVTAIPLPAGIYLFLSGLVGLGLLRGRMISKEEQK